MIEARGVRVPMRDGACLVTDACRPEETGRWPVLLLRTPYGRGAVVPGAERERLVEAGFAVVAQDCRGCFESEGQWSYVRGEVEDGYDTVEWAAAQPWSDGRVGMFGASYMGNAQWMAAIARPPHLVAIAPECCPADYWTASFEPGGVFRLALRVGWASSFAASMASHWDLHDERLAAIDRASTQRYEALARGDRDGALAAGAGVREVLHGIYRTRPFRDVASWHGRSRVLEEVFDHERRADAHWRRTNPSSHYDVLDLPAVHVAGWFDVHLAGTLENFTQMRRQAPTERARRAQRLVVGPWAHWDPQDHLVGDADFGAAAALDTVQLRIRWFAHWLQDGPDPGWAPVRIFVMGENAWRDEQEWPLARARATPWYLREGGRLDPGPPGGGERPDGYAFDPRTPVPTVGGRLLALGEVAGPRRQPAAGSRPDVLAYASDPLDEPLEVSCKVLAVLL
ncbi:MAG: CocE/NonD family hydrolase, partial [Acidimicrobiales bacterium]